MHGQGVAPLQNFQRGDQLGGAEFFPPRVVIGQRRQRANHIADDFRIAQDRAIGGLDAPDGKHHIPVDTVARLYPVEPGLPEGGHFPAVFDPLLRDRRADIIPDGLDEFGLIAGPFEDLRIRRNPVECLVVGRSGYSGGLRLRPEALYPGLKRICCAGACRIAQDQGEASSAKKTAKQPSGPLRATGVQFHELSPNAPCSSQE